MKKKMICIILVFAFIIGFAFQAGAEPGFITWPSNTIDVGFPPTNIIIADDGTVFLTNNYHGITKLLPDGSLDISFGTNGTAVSTIRPIFLCFDQNGDILTGNCDLPDGVMRISAETGASEYIIPDISVAGIATDSEQNIYVNGGSVLIKYDAAFTKVWEVPVITDYEMGICLLPDGSIITSNESNGSIQKYTSEGQPDTAFGVDGILRVSGSNIGFASYDNALYVSCYGDAQVIKVALDGSSTEVVMSGASPTIMVAKNGYYFIPNWLHNTVQCFERPNVDIENDNFTCVVSPTQIAAFSQDPVTLTITSDCTSDYTVTAKVYYGDGTPALEINSSEAVLNEGDAVLTLTPSANGWLAGDYYIVLVFTDVLGSITVSDTLQISATLDVALYHTITFKSEGNEDIIRTVLDNGDLTDIPAVPEKEGYTGTWDVTDFTTIKEDLVVNAVYTRNKVNVITTEGNIVEGVDGTLFDPDTVLQVNDITEKADKDNLNANIGLVANGKELISLFDIKLLLNNEPVQPDGNVKVKIKLTEELSAYTDLQVVFIDDQGNATVLESTIEDGYIVFTADHFSQYALIATVNDEPTETGDSSAIYVIIAALLAASVLIVTKAKRLAAARK